MEFAISVMLFSLLAVLAVEVAASPVNVRVTDCGPTALEERGECLTYIDIWDMH